MPHKHTRREKDESTYDLPPNQIAKPLPTIAPKQTRHDAKSGGNGKAKGRNNGTGATAGAKTQGVKRKRGAIDKKDDAPRAFKRLMAFSQGKKFRSGLDDGNNKAPSKNKKQKTTSKETANETNEAKKAAPTIRPGERLSDFAARVDAALPVMGLVSKNSNGGKDPLGLKVHRTRKEKKMHKLYDEWRREEATIQERRREEAEEAEEREMEDDAAGVKWRVDVEDEAAGRKKKKGKKGKKGRSVWETADDEDDPWEELKKKRGEGKIGLHDVVKAPPEFKHLPKQVLKVNGAAVDVGTIPKAAGSLKRREELQGVREEVVAAYRKMMEGKRARLDGEAMSKAGIE